MAYASSWLTALSIHFYFFAITSVRVNRFSHLDQTVLIYLFRLIDGLLEGGMQDCFRFSLLFSATSGKLSLGWVGLA